MTAGPARATAMRWSIGLELVVLLLDIAQQLKRELFSLVDHLLRAGGDVEIHLLVALASGVCLDEARASTFDLHTAVCSLLDVLDVGATVTNDLRAEVEARDGLERDWN